MSKPKAAGDSRLFAGRVHYWSLAASDNSIFPIAIREHARSAARLHFYWIWLSSGAGGRAEGYQSRWGHNGRQRVIRRAEAKAILDVLGNATQAGNRLAHVVLCRYLILGWLHTTGT